MRIRNLNGVTREIRFYFLQQRARYQTPASEFSIFAPWQIYTELLCSFEINTFSNFNQFQLKEKIAAIEKQLVNEQRKTEDLQFSIDEATFCSDELNVSTNTDRHASAFVCISDVDSLLDAPSFISRNIVFFVSKHKTIMRLSQSELFIILFEFSAEFRCHFRRCK